MKTVLLDVDGVLADFVGAALSICNNLFGAAFTPRDIKNWDIAQSLSLHPNDAAAMKRAIGNSAGLAGRLNVLPGAVDGVCRLQEIANVYIVTSPWGSNPTWTHDRDAWLLKNFDIRSSRVVHTSAKYLVGGDLFVDDKTSAVERWRDHDVRRRSGAIQWETSYNRLDEWNGRSTCNWNQLVEWAQ